MEVNKTDFSLITPLTSFDIIPFWQWAVKKGIPSSACRYSLRHIRERRKNFYEVEGRKPDGLDTQTVRLTTH